MGLPYNCTAPFDMIQNGANAYETAIESSLQSRGCCTPVLCCKGWTLANIKRASAAAFNQNKLYQDKDACPQKLLIPYGHRPGTVHLCIKPSHTHTAPPTSCHLHTELCRSGRSLTLVTQYDVELFQKIEALTGHKMEEYPAEQEAVLLLLERVGEAQRISTMQVRKEKSTLFSDHNGSLLRRQPGAPPCRSSY